MSDSPAALSPLPALAVWRPAANPWLIASAVMAATFMEVLDSTVVNVSLPHIAGSFSVTPEEATWVLTSYLVANAIVLPATGWLSSYFGRKNFLISCIVIFTIASALCGMATSLPMLILSRILQGAGGGALQPISQAVLLESFPPRRRGMAMAVFGLGVVVAPIIGPTLGGWMTYNYSWRWIFYLNLPVGVVALSMIQVFIEDPPYIRGQRRGGIDMLGFALLALWVSCFQIVLDKGQQDDWWGSEYIRTLIILASSGLVAFIAWELYTPQPLVNLRILKNRNFMLGTALMTVMGIVLYGSTALLPLFLQTLLGYTSLQSGLTTSPRGFGSIVGMLIVGRIIGLIDSRVLISLGFLTLGISTSRFALMSLDVAPNNIMWPNIINGFATALIFVPLTTLTMGTLRNEQMGNATGIFNLMRNLGGGIGIAMVTTMLSRGSQKHQLTLVGHMTPYDPAYLSQLHQIAGGLASAGSSAAHLANAILYDQMLRQASLLAYIDNFQLLALLSFLCIPVVVVFKRAKPRGGPSVGH